MQDDDGGDGGENVLRTGVEIYSRFRQVDKGRTLAG